MIIQIKYIRNKIILAMRHIQKFNESAGDSTRVLYINGQVTDNDFAASGFEKKFNGTKVSDILDNLEEYQDREEYELTVMKFDNIDPNFVKFIKDNLIDYDQSKCHNFYLESETIQR